MNATSSFHFKKLRTPAGPELAAGMSRGASDDRDGLPTSGSPTEARKVKSGSVLSAVSVLITLAWIAPTAHAEAAAGFRAGAATSNITPELGSTLRTGSFITYPATQIHDELFARCLVIDDGKTRIAFVVCDVLALSREVVDEAKRLIEKDTGLPVSHVITSAVHTHSAPAIRSEDGIAAYSLPPYHQFVARRMADGVRRAINNLAPARIAWGRGSLPGQVFNRRWFTKSIAERATPFGGTDQVRMLPTFASPDLIKPAGPTDPEIVFFSVQTRDGKPIALLANYGLHYVGGVRGAGDVSADYFAYFADRIQELLRADRQDPPFVGIMTNGASGDINNSNLAVPRERAKPYEKMRQVASEVADQVIQSYRQLQHRDHAVLKLAYQELALGTRHPTPDEAARVKEILSRPPAKGRSKDARDPRERAGYYANRAQEMAERPPVTKFPLQAVRIGELAIFTVPAEVFVEIGLELKERSAFKPAFVMGLANGYYGYLPTPRHHQLGGYETWISTNQVEVQASVKIVEALLRMQETLK